MIRLHFTEPMTKVWKRWLDDCGKAAMDVKAQLKRNQHFDISPVYRRKRIKQEVYFAKDGPFRGRCAYCEAYITDFQHGDIEHFRPKKGVSDADGRPVVVSGAPHPGYYWLAYSWRNLLPSCIVCNQPGDDGVGKHNRFPVEGARYALTDEELARERPLLLNPLDENDDPIHHLGIDLETGLMKAVNDSPRGQMCIKIFGLNKRDQLVEGRKSAVAEMKAKYAELLFTNNKQRVEELRSEIEAMERGAHSYTLGRRAQSDELRGRILRTPTEDATP